MKTVERTMKTVLIEQVNNGWIVNIKDFHTSQRVDTNKQIHVFASTKEVLLFVKAYLEV